MVHFRRTCARSPHTRTFFFFWDERFLGRPYFGPQISLAETQLASPQARPAPPKGAEDGREGGRGTLTIWSGLVVVVVVVEQGCGVTLILDYDLFSLNGVNERRILNKKFFMLKKK